MALLLLQDFYLVLAWLGIFSSRLPPFEKALCRLFIRCRKNDVSPHRLVDNSDRLFIFFGTEFHRFFIMMRVRAVQS
jgi:hypothetical protein